MQQIIRWPEGMPAVDHNTAKYQYSNVVYHSWTNPPWWSDRIVNLIFIPASQVRILSCRMLINTRIGVTHNPCTFNLAIFKTITGATVSGLTTTPPVLNAASATIFPLLTWREVFLAPLATAPVVEKTEYFALVYTKTIGPQSTTNNFECRPLVEVLTDF